MRLRAWWRGVSPKGCRASKPLRPRCGCTGRQQPRSVLGSLLRTFPRRCPRSTGGFSRCYPLVPAKAGTQSHEHAALDSRLRGNERSSASRLIEIATLAGGDQLVERTDLVIEPAVVAP